MNGYLHVIKRFPLASALNLLGLATALAACFILWAQVEFSENYNRCLEGCDNLYRVELSGVLGDKPMAYISRPAMEKIAALPQVEGVAIVSKGGTSTLWKNQEEYVHLTGWMLNPDGLKTLGARLICGVDSFATTNEVILSASYARMIFGTEMAAGKHFETTGGELNVVGVIEDFAENCVIPNIMFTSLGDHYINENGLWNLVGYVRLHEGVDAASTGKLMHQAAFGLQGDVDEEYREAYEKATADWDLSIRPLAETYFSGVDPTDKGNASMMLMLKIACLALLLVAAINFANFTLAETPMRIKGINTRKVLGVTNGRLRRGMIGETVMTALAAFCIAMIMVWLLSLSPWIQGMVAGRIGLEDNPHLIIYIGAIALGIGTVVGIYPAIYATSFAPAMVLKGSFGLSPRGKMLRQALVCIQLFVAFLMTIYLGVLVSQSSFIFNSDYGFDKDEIVYCDHIAKPESFDKIRAQLEAIPGVESVGFASHIPGVHDLIMKWGRTHGDTKMTQTVIEADHRFLQTLGIEIVEGRDFRESDSGCVIVNETTRDLCDWISIDHPMSDEGCPVVGICRNVRIHTARIDNASEQLAFLIIKDESPWGSAYRIAARVGKNVDKVDVKRKLDEALASNFPSGYPIPEFRFMDDHLQQSYEEEFRFIRQVEAFSVICLIVTMIGVFCLTMFETEYRRKEIGIRKVLGTKTSEIMLMFARRYLPLLAAAFLIAAPLAYKMGGSWLENFAERTPMHWWIWLVALAAVAAIVLLTVTLQTWKTANENPVNSIKAE